MSSLAQKERYGAFDDFLNIPGATIRTPPPLEERVFHVPITAEAYVRPSSDSGRSIEDIAISCLPESDEPFLPNMDVEHTIFNVKRKLGSLATGYINDRLSESTNLYIAAEMLLRVNPLDTRREMGHLIMNHEASNDDIKHKVARAVPEVELVDVADADRMEGLKNIDPRSVAKSANKDKEKVMVPKGILKVKHTFQSVFSPEFLSRSPLHSRAGNEVKKFSKTGGNTYILPKDLEASVRVVPIYAAAAWMRAFENWPEWYRRGFNYVPIEPIQDIAATDDSNMIAVTTTNLRGRSLAEVTELLPQYKEQLHEMREEVRSGLTDLHIQHHHLNDEDFVVVPYVHENGRPDLSRCPRLYMIDFDAAQTAL